MTDDNVKEIVNEAAEKYGVDPEDVLSRLQNKWVRLARRRVYRRLSEAGMSTGQIAELAGRGSRSYVGKVLSEQIKRKADRARPVVDTVANPNAIQIIDQVARRYGIRPEVLRGKNHSHALFDARREAYSRLRHERKLSYPQIGRLMGGRDHATIMHAVGAKPYRYRRQHQLTEGGHGARDARPVTATDSAVAAHG